MVRVWGFFVVVIVGWLGFFALFENAPRKAKRKQEASALSGQNLTEKGHDSLKIKKKDTILCTLAVTPAETWVPDKVPWCISPRRTCQVFFVSRQAAPSSPLHPSQPRSPPGARPRPRRRVRAGGRAARAGHRSGRAGQGEGPAAAQRSGVRNATCPRGTARPDPRAPGGASRWGGRREQTIEPARPHPERGSPRRCSAGPRAKGGVSSRGEGKVAGRGGQQGCGVPPSPPAMWLRGRVASRLPSLFAGGRDAHAHPSSPGWVSPAPTPAAPTPPSPGQLRQGTATATAWPPPAAPSAPLPAGSAADEPTASPLPPGGCGRNRRLLPTRPANGENQPHNRPAPAVSPWHRAPRPATPPSEPLRAAPARSPGPETRGSDSPAANALSATTLMVPTAPEPPFPAGPGAVPATGVHARKGGCGGHGGREGGGGRRGKGSFERPTGSDGPGIGAPSPSLPLPAAAGDNCSRRPHRPRLLYPT